VASWCSNASAPLSYHRHQATVPDSNHTCQSLLALAKSASDRSYVPYSSRKRGAVVLLSNGQTVPGVRVENASFQLVIPASVNALSTALALGRSDIVALGLTPGNPEDGANESFLRNHPLGPFNPSTDGIWTRTGQNAPLPPVLGELEPFVSIPSDVSADEGVALAAQTSRHAYIPESHFPVGCLMILSDGRAVPGVNCEHPDWPFVLCAERNALGTIVSYGLPITERILLSCPGDANASPCGACRQVLVELAPEASVWMDRGNSPVEETSVTSLLPGFFSGDAIRKSG